MTVPALPLLSWTNHADRAAAALTASSQSGDLSPSNVADPIVGRRWRTTDLSGWIQLDAGADVAIHAIALAFSRDTGFPTAGTVRHRIDASGGTPGTGAVYDSTAISLGTQDGYGYHLHVPASVQTGRYLRCTFAVSGVSYIDLGRLWAAGEAFRPTFHIQGGYEDSWRDLSQIAVAQRSGAEFVDSRPRRRELAFGLNGLSAAERTTLREMNRLAGNSAQVLFCLDPDSFATETVIGRWGATLALQHVALSQQLYRQSFLLRESL